MAPSQLQVAISSLKRLLKEEASYYKEQEHQETRIAKLEKDETDEDGNREFTLKQEVRQFFTHNGIPFCLTGLMFYTDNQKRSVKPWKKPRKSFLLCVSASPAPERNWRICWYVDFLNPIPPVGAPRTDLIATTGYGRQ